MSWHFYPQPTLLAGTRRKSALPFRTSKKSSNRKISGFCIKRVINRKTLQKVMLKKKNLLIVAGVTSTILGIIGAVPSFLGAKYGVAVGATVLIVAGLVLLAIAFED